MNVIRELTSGSVRTPGLEEWLVSRHRGHREVYIDGDGKEQYVQWRCIPLVDADYYALPVPGRGQDNDAATRSTAADAAPGLGRSSGTSRSSVAEPGRTG